ncbi:MAG TPA: endolytic transglycosylase MltG [Candidatus Acidoferrales bacterium]|nr:endolytic transglycosylase MltG [Candidatus Acidoferrales bacterium]
MRARRRGPGWGRWALVAALVLLVAAGAAGVAVGVLRADWRTPYAGYAAGGVFVEIPRGMREAGIARTLAESGVVRSEWSFRALATSHAHTRLEAGEYRFERAETPEEVFETLAHGRIYLVTVPVPEGETMFDIAGLLAAKQVTTREEFLAAAESGALVADLAPGAPSLEGFLFPATYQFPRHQAGEKIAAAMVRRFRESWARTVGQVPESERPGGAFGALQIVTLASLVEKETAVPEERPLVSAVFRNRLRKGTVLACDPTVIYGMVLAGKYNGQLLLADLRMDSPYNTYRRRGLPPGPIANPGEASLLAAMQPASGEWMYFVATGDGGHAFSRTLAEHNKNVAKYRRKEAAMRRAARAQATAKPTR